MSQRFSSRSTESFRALLDQSGTSLVISTYQAGQLVVVRPQASGVNTHFIAFDKPMGMAVRPGELVVGSTHQLVTYRNLPAVGPRLDQEPTDACYLPRRIDVTGAIDVHEMGFDAENNLWFVNTSMSCLATLAPEYSFRPRWRPPFISEYDLTDRCHLNGLGFRDGKPRYVSMLGASDRPGGWRRNKVSGGRIMDIDNDELLVDALCMPHSPRWYRDRLYFLSSGAGQLMRAEPGKPADVVAEVPGFARGLDFIGRYALVGLSQVRESAVFAGLPLTRRVDERKSGVWVIDIETGETVAFLEFTGNVQEVFEVKVLPHRYPAVLELGHPLAATAYELPDEVIRNLAPPNPVAEALDAATRDHIDGKLEQAIQGYREILAQDPGHRQANHQLGLCLVDAKRWDEAIAQLEKVIETQPDNAEAMNSLGMAWSSKGEQARALAWFDQSLATDGQFAHAHFNRGLILLKLGDYQAGWPEYDWRWQTPKFVPFQCRQPLWQGEDIADKRLLVHSEQGNGDHLQFMRFLPLAAERCKELIYVGPEALSPLAAEIPGVSESRVPGAVPLDRFDVYCPLMSLPRWLGITRETLPAPERYLVIPEHVMVSRLEGDFKVGLAWAGSSTHAENAERSIPLESLAPLLQRTGISFFSLQMPLSADERALLECSGVKNLEAELPGYARSAALVDQLDLVISVDTAIAHLAGALGKPLWLMLGWNPDWRWGLDGETTPWYPSAVLYRQPHAEHWRPVIDRIAVDLARMQG